MRRKNESALQFNSVVYKQNGTQYTTEQFVSSAEKGFYIQAFNNNIRNGYFYPGDQQIHKLDAELAMLGERFRCLILPNDEEFFVMNKCMPIFIATAGLSSDTSVSKESYAKMLTAFSVNDVHKPYTYLADVEYLISSVQNLLIGLETNLVDYFRLVSSIHVPYASDKNATYVVRGEEAERVTSILGSYYVKLYSIMDLLTKITYEFENPRTDFSSSIRLRSNGILYNHKSKLHINSRVGTIFLKDYMLTEIETIRNEIIHNGTWEDGAKVYVDIVDGIEASRYILYPDMNEGRFVSHLNRHHFFSQGTKVNDVLPTVHAEFVSRVYNTVKCIIEASSCEQRCHCHNNPND